MGCSGKLEAEGWGEGGHRQAAAPPRLRAEPLPAPQYLRRQEKSPVTRDRSAGLLFSLAFHCRGQS